MTRETPVILETNLNLLHHGPNICQPLIEMLQHIVKTTQDCFSLSVPPSHVCLFLFPEPEPIAPLAVQILPCLGLFYIWLCINYQNDQMTTKKKKKNLLKNRQVFILTFTITSAITPPNCDIGTVQDIQRTHVWHSSLTFGTTLVFPLHPCLCE